MPEQGAYRVLWGRDSANELAAAECFYLTGGRLDGDGIASCDQLDELVGAAYAQAGIELIAAAPQFDQLVHRLQELALRAEGFRIEFRRLPGADKVAQRPAIVAVANCLEGAPQLDQPQQRFFLVGQAQGWWFGRLVAEPSRSYTRHDDKPYRTSSSLPARLARGLVNLVASHLQESAQALLDPCCGTGSILLEASDLGLVNCGLDWNEKMVGMSRENTRHFNYSSTIEHGDARQWQQPVGAVVTDLPYGKNLEVSPEVIDGILAQGARIAPLGVYVAGADLRDALSRAGYEGIEIFRVPKSNGFSRYVHRATSSHCP